MTKRKRWKYELLGPDDWVMPSKRDFKMMCCDCGLVHRIVFGTKGRIVFKAIRDERATAQARRRIRREENVGR